MQRPNLPISMRHLALCVQDLPACEAFYTELLGMSVEWRPDVDNVYLTTGSDNLALHKAVGELTTEQQRLDHLGFMLATIEAVDAWYEFLVANDVPIVKGIKTHRDGARSFYCRDPEGNVVQFIYHPPLADQIQ